MLPSKKIE